MGEKNWAGNLEYGSSRVERPRTVDEVRRLVAEAPLVRALGTRHSFSAVADTPGVHVDLSALEIPLVVDPVTRTATVGAGVRYGELVPALHDAGFALPNLPSLPHCSVAGTVATATHGSGRAVRALSSDVSGVDLVTADGDLRRITRADNPEVFPGVPVNLGALGVVTSLTLDLVDPFDVRQDGYVGLDWSTTLAEWDAVHAAGYSVCLFTRWVDEVPGMFLVKSRVEPGEDFQPLEPFRSATAVLDPPGENSTDWFTPGPWHTRLPHFRLEGTPSVGDELQSEYFVPAEHAVQALTVLREIAPRFVDALHVTELRTVAGDDFWLSPAYGGDRLCIQFTWQPKPVEVAEAIPVVEEALAPFSPRPHWGKLSSPAPAGAYPKLQDFKNLADSLDPEGKFRNRYLDQHVFGM